jgi:transcriptional regulator of arginine metabolism
LKIARHSKVLELIKRYDIETQEELANYLRDAGFQVTQATVSRDIKELRLVKTLSKNGAYRYDTGERNESGMINRFLKIFSNSVISLKHTGQIIIIKTLSGSANAAAEAVDSLDWPEIAGTIAGDNTIFVVCTEEADVKEVVLKFANMMK